MSDPLIGRILHGTIKIVRRIGEGGMGYVYEGYQEHLERKVAIKVMTPEHARNPVAAEYFLREAKSSSRLRHPNIIQIIDFGKESDDLLFLAMEFVPGRPLSDIIEEEFPLSAKRIASIMMQALYGLEEAHAHEIVHRDLKPDNLMIEQTRTGQDFVKILDFGIAHMSANDAKPGSLTQQGALLGTPQYMSPEQACGEKVDARSDLFSMGIILYEMLTGQQPFSGNNLPKLLMNIISEDVVAPSALRDDLSIQPALEAICLRALQKEKELRYQSASAFRLALKEIQDTGSFQKVEKAQPARFIFKKRPKSELQQPQINTEQGVVSDSFNKKQNTPFDDESHVLDVQSLFSTNITERPAEPTSEPFPVPLTPQPPAQETQQQWALANTLASFEQETAQSTKETLESKRPSTTKAVREGLASLRNDLMGNNLKVVSLCLHQRTNRAFDPEELMEFYEILEHVALEVAESWEGVVHSKQGGFTTLLFGLPQMRSDDIFRATQAALDVRKRLRRQNLDGFSFGFALAEGDVFYPPNRPLSQIAGIPIEQATAQSREAGNDEIVIVGEPLQDQLSSAFKLGPPMAQNQRTLINALNVELTNQNNTDHLAGREREIASILATLGRLSRKQGALIAIQGFGGMGKSALIHEILRLADQRKFQTLHARKRSGGTTGILDLFKQWLRDYLRQVAVPSNKLSQSLNELGMSTEYVRILQGFLTDKLQDVFSYKGKARAARQEISAAQSVQAAMRQFLKLLSIQTQLVLCLDGIDPYDDALGQFLSKSMDIFKSNAIVLFLAIRTYPGQPAPELPQTCNTLLISPLDEATTRAFLKLKLPALADHLQRKIIRLSAGNPLQLNQLIAFVQANPDAMPHEVEAALSKLDGITKLLQLQLQRQPKHVQNVLGLMAILGDGVDADAVADLSLANWSYDDALQYAYDKELIYVEENKEQARLFFENPLFGQVIYKSMPKRGLEKTHKRAAQYYYNRLKKPDNLHSLEDKQALVRHLEAADAYEDAIRLTESIVHELMLTFDYEQAEALLRRTLRMREKADDQPVERMAELQLMLARLLERQGRTKDALNMVLKLNRQPSISDDLLNEIRLELGAMWLEEEDPSLVEKMLKRVAKATRQDLRATGREQALWMHIRAMQMLSIVYEKQDKLLLAMDNLLQAIELIEQHNVNPTTNPWGPSLVWEPLNQLGRMRIKNKEYDSALAMFKLALEVVQDAQDAMGEVTVISNLSSLYILNEDYHRAHKALQQAIIQARKIGQVRTLAKLFHNRGLLYMRQHNAPLAKPSFEESLELCKNLDWREGLAMNANQLRRLNAN